MGCDCGKPKCDGHCGVSPAVLQINNPSECVLFRKVEVPASMGTSVENPPKPGAYRNVLLYYNADGEAYLYTSDGIPTKVTGTTSNYEILTNKPKINGVELVGDKSLADIGVTDAIDDALEDYTPTSEFAEVAFSGSYTDLTDKPDTPSGLHVFHMGPASVGNTAPIYHDYEKTNQVTLAQFIDAIASGPVQIYKAYDMRSFQIYYVDQMDAFIPDPPQYTGTLYVSFGLRNPYGLGVERFSWYEPDTAPTYDSYDPNQSDWNETSSTNSSYIKNKPNLATVATSGSYNDLSNKPTIPAAQVNSDWNASSGVAQILNKPTLASVATSGNYDDLSNKPTIPAAQVNSDWNAASGVAQILNKPSLATVATSGSYNDLTNKPTIGNATLTIQKNGTSAGTFTANATSNKTINITVPTTAADVSALPASTKYGASIAVSINTTDYKVTTTLKDQDGNTLGTAQVIDLPLESVVVNGSYDSTNKKIVLTLQSGSTIDIPVADLVAGLQSEITSTNKLASDLVDDTNQTHKFMTSAEKTKLSGIATGAEVNVQSDWNQTTTTADDYIKNKPTLATVATSGSYNDLSNKPTIPTVNNATLTIQKNGTNVQTFTANQSTNATANITVPTKTSDLTNDSGFLDSVAWGDVTGKPTFATVATSGSYNDLANKPTIPTFTLTTTDPGEGAALAANTFIGVYN